MSVIPTEQPGPQPAFYSVAQAATLFGMSQMTLYRAIGAGQFPALRIRGRLIIPARAIDEMVADAMAEHSVVDASAWVRYSGPPAKTVGSQAMWVSGPGGGL